MKKVKYLTLMSLILTIALVNADDNTLSSIIIEDTDLKGGGQEYAIIGTPDVITKTKLGTIYSEKTQMIILKNNEKLINYSGKVQFELEKHNIIISSEEMTDKGDNLFTFIKPVSLSSFDSSKATNSFSCSGGNVVKNGQSTGHSPITYRNVLTISCDSNNVLSITVKR